MAGFFTPALAGMLLAGGCAGAALAQDGPPLPANADPPRVAALVRPVLVPIDEAIRLDHYLNRLDEWRQEGRINMSELARARRLLDAAIVRQDPNVRLPYDVSGRIDLLALARGAEAPDTQPRARGERAIARLFGEVEIRMRVTPRDLAYRGSVVLLDGAPGYTAIPSRDTERLVKRALEGTPLNDLPGGAVLASVIEGLPNTGSLDASKSLRELGNLIGDRQRQWFNPKVAGLIDGHEVAASLLAFGAVTALRAASPETARFLDRLRVKARIFRESTKDARLYATGRLAYRNGHMLPELDLEGGARHVLGATTLRATAIGTVAAGAGDRARGRVALGARWERGNLFADTNATYAFPESLIRPELRGGYLDGNGFALSGAIGATFGHGPGATGVASGRIGYEVDLTKEVKVGRAMGDVGLFIGGASDRDFRNDDMRGGLMLRVRF